MVRGMAVITRRLLERFPRLPLDDEQVTAMAWYGGCSTAGARCR